jgi:Leucine-rich repeat (LRR) protein
MDMTTTYIPSLTTLNVANNTGLTSLSVINNKLTTFIGTNLVNLTSLTLSGNKMATMPDITTMVKLTTLSVSTNLLAGNFSCIGFPTTLTDINVSSNIGVTSIACTLGNLTTFTGS